VSVGVFVNVFVHSLTCFRAEYLENGWRLGSNGPPIGNGIWQSIGHMTDDVT